jgi:sulfite reductase alpha subunit-like flavoprotein
VELGIETYQNNITVFCAKYYSHANSYKKGDCAKYLSHIFNGDKFCTYVTPPKNILLLLPQVSNVIAAAGHGTNLGPRHSSSG